MIELRPYQVEVGAAVMRSIEGRKGYTFSVEMARQAGKNELSAQLEMLILSMNAARGGQGVKASPTFKPQTLNSIQRLKDRLLDNGLRSASQTRFSYQVAFGRAAWLFFSAEPTANVVGATANLLLEGDEAQDIDVEKWQRDFRPMGATANVTTILYGTAWSDDSLLEQQKQTNLELERRDGEQRHFEYPWDVVARYNPDYKVYVEGERDRLGPDHPLFVTQYELRPLSYLGRMFTAAQLDVMRAGFGVSSDPDGSTHIAGLDIAGAAESIEDPEQILTGHADRDSTVLSIGAVRAGQLHVVRTYEWIGVPHFQAVTAEVAALCRHWRVRSLYADATGIGAPVVETLAQACACPGDGGQCTVCLHCAV